MSDADLESAYRNRASLPPAQRAAVEQAHAAMVVRRNRERGLPNPVPGYDNVENDLDASSSPLTPEPEVKPKAAPSVAKPNGWQDMSDEEMVAPLADEPGGGFGVTVGDLDAYGRRYRQAVHNTIDRGVARRQAAQAAGVPDPGQYAYNRATGLSEAESGARGASGASGPSWSGEQTVVTPDGLEVPVAYDNGIGGLYYTVGAERAARAAREEAYRDAGGRRAVPGPRDDATGKAEQGREFSSPKEAEVYYTRQRDPQTGRLMPSQADRDMLARGFVAAYSPTGEITYLMAANRPSNVAQGMSPYAQRQAGYYEGVSGDGRTDLNLPRNYEVQTVDGPFGPTEALVPTRAARDRQAARSQRDAARRVAARTGQSVDAMMDPEARRDALLGKYEQDQQSRRRIYSDMAGLAGGSSGLRGGPGGNMGMFKAIAMLNGVDPNNMDARQQALMQGLPINPQRALIEAQNMANAGDVIKRFMTSGAAGAMMGPEARAVAALAADDARRERNPFGAGQSDIARGDVTTPHAQQTLGALAEQHDTGGLGTMSWDDENALASTLQKPPYNLTKPDAEAAAHQAAEGRRWSIFGARGYAHPSTSPAARPNQ